MQLGLLKALYIDQLTKLYSYSEAENLFYITLQWLEKKSKTAVILGQETLLVDTYQLILKELLEGSPIQYLIHEAPFYGLDFYVDENVLIPRPETEELVHWVITENQNYEHKILDIGTGSGCISIVLAKHLSRATVSACDISLEALSVARKNAQLQGVTIDFFQHNILNGNIGHFDLIVSNPPYISFAEKNTMHQNVLDHEPHLALFVNHDNPLIFYQAIIKQAKAYGTTCYFETSEFYKKEFDQWLTSQELKYTWKEDFQGKSRFLKVQF